MSLFFNPGNENFRMKRYDDYIDKTEMISIVNRTLCNRDKLSCVSRPRRFGKTYATAMLAAYYDKSCDSHELFDDLAISKDPDYEKHLNKYNVMYLDMSFFIAEAEDKLQVVAYTRKRLIGELMRMYPEYVHEHMTVSDALEAIVDRDGSKYIAIIDEWDAPLRRAAATAESKEEYLEFLLSLFKNTAVTEKVFAGAYMTGILPIKKDGSQSAVSEFREYSILEPEQFAPYIGFTEDEVIAFCTKKSLDFNEMKRWYDGYTLPGAGEIYNSNSVMLAASYNSYKSYWQMSSAAGSLMEYLNMGFDGLGRDVDDLLKGNSITVNTTTFRNDMYELNSRDEVITLLIHFGYLAYDHEDGSCHIPNLEIELEFQNSIRQVRHAETMNRVKLSDTLFDAIEDLDEEETAKLIKQVHDEECSPRHYNKEDSLRQVIKLALFTYRDYYTGLEEVGGGNGYADMVFIPRRAARRSILIIELKKDDTPENAIRQIKDRGYMTPYLSRKEDILLIGVTYDSNDPEKKHRCVIEEYER